MQDDKAGPETADDELLDLIEHAIGHAMPSPMFNSSTRAERRKLAEAAIGAIYGNGYRAGNNSISS